MTSIQPQAGEIVKRTSLITDARQLLWIEVFLKACVSYDSRGFAVEVADYALSEFDKRFGNDKQP